MAGPPPSAPSPPLPDEAERAAADLARTLARVRRRRLLQTSVGWIGWTALAVTIALGSLWILVVAGLRGPWIGWAPALIAGCAALAAAGVTVVRTALRTREVRRLASTLDRAMPRDSVRVAVELLDEYRAGRLSDPFALARMASHLGRTARRAARVGADRVLPWSRTDRVGLLSIPLVALALVVSVAPGPRGRLARALEHPRAEGIADPDTEVPEAALHLRDVEVWLTPPSYTGEEAELLPSGSGSFTALPGTRAEVLARVDAPPGAVTFQVGEGPWQVGEVVAEDQIRVEFTVGQERSYRVQVETAARSEPLHSGALTILLREDAPPRARLALRPEEPVELQAGDDLGLTVVLEDDFGLGGLDRVLLRDGVEIARETLAGLEEGARSATVEDRWTVPDASRLAAGALSLRYDALDNDAVLGPKRGSSEPLRIRLLGRADLRRRAAIAQEELLEALLLALAEHLLWLDGLDEGGGDPAEVSRRARERMATALDVASRVQEGMKADPGTDGLDYAAVGSAMVDAARSWDRLAQLLRRSDIEGEMPREIGEVLDDHIRNLERAALLLDRQRMATRKALAADAARRASSAMEALEEALASGDQGAISAAMAELQQRMAELARELARIDPGRVDELMNAQRGSVSPDLMAQLQQMMAAGRTAEAMELLRDSARTMAQLQQMAGQGANAAEALAQLDTALQEVSELSARQDRLNRELAALESAFPGTSGPTGLEEIREDLAQLREQVGQLARPEHAPRLDGVVRGRTGRAERQLQSADEGLVRADLDQAIRGLARSDDELLELLELAELVDEAGSSGLSDAAFSAWVEDVVVAEAEHLRILEQVLAAERAWRDARASAGQGAAPMAPRQREVADGASATGESMGSVDGLSWDGASHQRRMQDVEQLMRGAADDMEVGQVPRARDSGEQAVAQLERLATDLQQARDRIEQGAQQGSAGGIAMSAMAAQSWQRLGRGDGLDPTSGMVELPPPGRFAGPEELREAAMEAATEDAPPDYRPLNDRYYEELVR